jgi:hypothetical protein
VSCPPQTSLLTEAGSPSLGEYLRAKFQNHPWSQGQRLTIIAVVAADGSLTARSVRTEGTGAPIRNDVPVRVQVDARALFMKAAVGQWTSTACRQRHLAIRDVASGTQATFDSGSAVRSFFRDFVASSAPADVQPQKAGGTFQRFSINGGDPIATLRVFATVDPSLPQWSATCTVVVQDGLLEVAGSECATNACGLTGIYEPQKK